MTAVAAPVALDVDAYALVVVYRLARDKPEEHDPTTWGYESPCGSAFCLAGITTVWASTVAGDELAWQSGGPERFPHRDLVGAYKDGRFLTVFEYARRTLRLDVTRATILFHRDATLEDIRTLIMAWIGDDPDTVDISALAATS